MISVDTDILAGIYSPLEITKEPFKPVAEDLGINEAEVLDTIKKYKEEGIIRRFGAVLNHRKIGLCVNALVCWQIDETKMDFVHEVVNEFSQISHCYLRESYPEWPYNFYTMVHSRGKDECMETIKGMASKIKAEDYRVLFTLKEFKKTRPLFFNRREKT